MTKYNWEYCECGCKCLVLNKSNIHLFIDLKGSYFVWEGRFRSNIKEHKDIKLAYKDGQNRLVLK